jgi:glycosyltransferase involved in cell wall biosynthesis
MNIWLITIGEPLPGIDGTKDRLLRTGYLSKFMADKGNNVTWWTSTFNHYNKRHFYNSDTTLQITKRLQIKLLHGCGYRKNLSLSRLLDHKQIAYKFLKTVKRYPSPDIILCSLPIIELSLVSVNYGIAQNIPVVLDLRDMWPDIFIDHIPKMMRPLARIIAEPIFRDARKALARATAITGISNGFVDWGIKRGRRTRTYKDKAFPIGYTTAIPNRKDVIEAESYWDKKGVIDNDKTFIVCFIGTIGHQFDLTTIIIAARKLKKSGKHFSFVICGMGDAIERYKRIAKYDTTVSFPGWMNFAQIYVLMLRSAVAIDPLPNRYDFLVTINNKAFEYMSAGLPIVSCPDKGVLYDLLKERDCGMSYSYGDANGLSECLAELYDDRQRLKKMSGNSKRLFKEKFAAERVYKDMAQYLCDIANEKRK